MKPIKLYDLLMEMKAAGANDASIAMTAIRELEPNELYDLLMEMKAAGANDVAIAMTAIRKLEPTGSTARTRRYRYRKRHEIVTEPVALPRSPPDERHEIVTEPVAERHEIVTERHEIVTERHEIVTEPVALPRSPPDPLYIYNIPTLTYLPTTSPKEREKTLYEGKKEKKPSTRVKKAVSKMTEDWRPSREVGMWTLGFMSVEQARDEKVEFIKYWIGEGKGRADWDMTWKNRIKDVVARRPNFYKKTPDAPKIKYMMV